MNKRIIAAAASLGALCTAFASPAAGQTIMAPDIVVDATGTTVVNGNGNFPLSEITDGITADTSPQFNGFQGRNQPQAGWNGDIAFNLSANYDVDRFHIWNDINVRSEGLAGFTLKLLDSNNNTLHTQSFTTTPGVAPMQTFMLSTTVRNVKRVILQVDSVHQQTAIRRVEIREVALSGVKSVPDGAQSVSLDNFVCYDLLAHENSPAYVRPGSAGQRSFVLTDQFGQATTRVGNPVKLCNPVGINDRKGRPAEYHAKYKDHLVCYQLYSAPEGRPGVFNVYVNNTLIGASMVSSGDRDELCVKSSKLYESEIGNGPPRPADEAQALRKPR